MNSLSRSIDDVIDEITRLHRSLPSRPAIDDVDAALALLHAVDHEEKTRIESITKEQQELRKNVELVPEELLGVQEQLQRSLVGFQGREQKREAVRLLDLENTHVVFDQLVQKAERCLALAAGEGAAVAVEEEEVGSVGGMRMRSMELKSRDDKEKGEVVAVKAAEVSGDDQSEKLSLIKFASLIESSFKTGTRVLNLSNKLMDQVDWLPASISKLSTLITLNLSDNQLSGLPTSIGSLPSLKNLDLHCNRLIDVPNSIGDLLNLLTLDLKGNQLTSIPTTLSHLTNLVELDLSSNRINAIPDSIGSLTNLKKLNIDANNVEELPHTIGHCISLIEVRADYNRLKGLPEALGRLELLELLSVRYNNIKSLPTTMASLRKLKELDVSFNELEHVPESLCLATTIVKLNVSNNFADMRALPRSIGNLEMLEELDVSNNQIRALPDSFGMLSHLRVLRLEENPLKVPPKHIAKMEAQAVVEYMGEFVAKKAIKLQPLKATESCSKLCFFSRANKRKHDDLDYRRA